MCWQCYDGSLGLFYNSLCSAKDATKMQSGGGKLFFTLVGNFLQVSTTFLMLLTKINGHGYYSMCSSWFTALMEPTKFHSTCVSSDCSQWLSYFQRKIEQHNAHGRHECNVHHNHTSEAWMSEEFAWMWILQWVTGFNAALQVPVWAFHSAPRQLFWYIEAVCSPCVEYQYLQARNHLVCQPLIVTQDQV